MTRTGQNKSLIVRHPVFGSQFPVSPSHFPFHSSLVASQKGDVISEDQFSRVGRALRGSLKGVLSLLRTVKKEIAESTNHVPGRVIRIESPSYIGLFDRLLIPAE